MTLPDAPPTRLERDFLGERPIPDAAYWGVHTARAQENFPISGVPLHRHRRLVAALGVVKQAAGRANHELGLLDDDVARAIDEACAEVRAGTLDQHFVVDVIQGGAGTSTNMNANEVIANRALELLGSGRGDYGRVNPNDHVNLSQSTNDSYPTALRIALSEELSRLGLTVRRLADAFTAKAQEFAGIPKVGRTQLQDAVPMTVGQEFAAWAATMREELPRLEDSRRLLHEVNLAGTAIGTQITTVPGYREAVLRHLVTLTGLPLVSADDLIEATSDVGCFVQVSAMLKRTAVKVSKICNDLRLLSSGPQAGLGELRLPARQAGSSIMPGKVNPVIPEVVNQVAFAVVGNDVTITMAAEAGQLQLNAFEPVIAHRLLEGIDWTARALDVLRHLCVEGIEADCDRLAVLTGSSVGVVTALTPHIGYATAAAVARQALAGEGTVRDLVLALGVLTGDQLDQLLHVDRLTCASGDV
ncbi:aspartate ammonia-lyase [Jiangella aurantiaca]|uniref:Aspartate ammonia-lyase n=1 Tax=Jiangella aurantiaca TaxID=2530373 RepID=A0A4R5AIF6_9ACTN|nr:aspartate ammonia-lyase [Jiangella aurantiaca]TDD71270.1 aspartate ammonia-lyase [Jiangella aurantiaca]